MDKKLISIATILLLSVMGLAQTNIYHPLPESDVVWRVQCSGLAPQMPVDLHCTDIEYYFMGDTIFGSVSYKKLMARINYLTDSCNTSPGIYVDYAGAIRQDTIQKKVFFKYLNQNEEILYDFDLSVGDTLVETYINLPNTYFVSSIDSILIGNTYRNRFFISTQNSLNYAEYIEGVGSSLGLLYSLNNTSGWNCELVCYSVDGNSLYPNTNANCGLPPLAIAELSIEPKLNIVPNPFIHSTTISSDDNFNNATIILYNLYGQEIKRIDDIFGNSFTLDRSHIPAGLYLIRLTQNGKTLKTQKLIVED